MSTRSKKKQSIPDTKDSILRKRVENSWILLIKESILEQDNFQIISLPHPGHGNSTKFVLDSLHHKIYEVVTFSEPYRSWFIGDTVKSDGSIMMVTPINPLFLVLPRLRQQCVSRAIPLEDLLSEKGFDKILDYITNLDSVADLKVPLSCILVLADACNFFSMGPQDMKAYKYNEEKTLNWLENKIRKLAIVLKEKNVHVTSGAVSATFVTSNVNNENIDEEFYLKYAHGIMSDYLEDEIAELLENKFDFKKELIEHIGNKRKSEIELEEVNKKIKMDSNGESEEVKFSLNNSFIEIKKQKPLTAKEKARQKAASKTKTISSFFVKK